MKKLLSAILAMLLIMSISAPAFADMGPPYFKEYDVRVINKDGAPLYQGDTIVATVPYDTVLTVQGDYYEDGKVRLSVDYNDDWGYIDGKDAVMIEDGVHYSEGVKLKHAKRYVVLEEGVRFYKGPGFGYETVGEEIPVGTEFSSRYALNNSSDVAWTYASVNGTEGWVYVYQFFSEAKIASVVTKHSNYGNDLYIFDTGAKLLDKPGDMDAQIISEEIPVGTKLEFKYYFEQPKSIFVQVEYNGVTGWLETDTGYNGENLNNTAIAKTVAFWFDDSGIPIYSKMGDVTSEIIGYVEEHTLLETVYSCFRDREVYEGDDWKYYSDSWYGINVNDQLGWINITNDTDCDRIWDVTQQTVCVDNTAIYSDSETSSEIIGTAPLNADILVFNWEDDMCLIDYEGRIGWIKSDNTASIPIDDDDFLNYSKYNHTLKDYFAGNLTSEYLEAIRLGLEIEDDEDEEDEEEFEENTFGDSVAQNKQKDKKDSLSSTQIIIFCVAGVAVVAITAIVIIVLINKKKKQ